MSDQYPPPDQGGNPTPDGVPTTPPAWNAPPAPDATWSTAPPTPPPGQGVWDAPPPTAAIAPPWGPSNGPGPQPWAAPHPGYPAPNPYAPMVPAGYAPKSKIAAGLLGIFLGGFGIHNFYLGYTGKAVAQIVVTFLTCGLGSIWGLVEGILILTGSINTDANGVPLVN